MAMNFFVHILELVVYNILKNRDDRIMFKAKNGCFSKTCFLKKSLFCWRALVGEWEVTRQK